jgi:hypothetical protein
VGSSLDRNMRNKAVFPLANEILIALLLVFFPSLGDAATYYKIEVSAGSGGAISPSGSVQVPQGSRATFRINPSANYAIKEVLVNGESIGAKAFYTFKAIRSNQTITANFVPTKVIISATADLNGTISPSGQVTVKYKGSRTFHVTPRTGHEIADVQVNGVSVGSVSRYRFQHITSNQTISASFAPRQVTVSATAGSNGTISPSGQVAVKYNGSQTFHITPDTGHVIADVQVDGVSLGRVSSYTFQHVTSKQTISASFAPEHVAVRTTAALNAPSYQTAPLAALALLLSDEIEIIATAGSNGTISPSGRVLVPYGGSQTFTIAPSPGYQIGDVLVDGASVGSVTGYEFSSVSKPATIIAAFVPSQITISATADSYGTISPSGQVLVPYGGSQTFTITPSPGYQIGDVQVDGVSVGKVPSYSFTEVSRDQSISCTFASDSTPAGVTLAWDPVTEPTSAKYRIHLGLASLSYDQHFEAGNATTYTLTGLEVGRTYYAAATTYVTSGGESGFSNEVSFTVTTQAASASSSQAFAVTSSGGATASARRRSEASATSSRVEAGKRPVEKKPGKPGVKDSKREDRERTSPTKPLIVAGLGFFPESGGIIELFDLQELGELPIYVDWPEYFTANGETRLATGDLDGDGRDEIVIGFASVPGNPDVPGGLFHVLAHDYSLIAWGRVQWAEYNRANGETRPAVGDMDGDGKTEIIIGLGPGGQGKCEVFSLQGGKLVHKGWLSLDWQDYDVASGETRPALGDLNGDGRAEVVVGLGQVPDNPGMAGGMFRLFGNDKKALGWGRSDWSDYNRLNGETWPAVGDINGDGKSEIILGLGNRGAGRVEIMGYDPASGKFAHKAWKRLPWSDYNEAFGETRPVARSIDDDPADEILIGLGRGGRGTMLLFDDAENKYTPLASFQLQWSEYNLANGETWPAIFMRQP